MKKTMMERVFENGFVVARWCDDSLPVTDFNYSEEALWLCDGEFYFYEYATAQWCLMKKISAERAVQWVNDTFYGARADELTAEIQKG